MLLLICKMEILKGHIFQLITDKIVNCCCLCLKNVAEGLFSVFDSVSFNYLNNIQYIDAVELLNYVLGVECVQNLTTDTLCKDCLEMLLKCYKFMKTCKDRAKHISKAINSMEKFCNDIKPGEADCKTIYLTLNESSLVGTQYIDQRSVTNCEEALKRLECITNPIKQDEQLHDSEMFDSSEFLTKDKRKRSNKEDFLDKVPTTEIIYDIDLGIYKCKVCQRMFPRLHNLKRHYVRVHAPKDFACAKCNKGFGSPAILAEHKLESHSGKKAICIECGKKYGSAKSLKLHELSHKLILKCGICDKFFNRQRNYVKHINSKRCEKVQRRSFVEKKFICDHCNKKYTCKGTLRVHIQFEHGNSSHHICSWCGKKFCSLSKLKAHTVTHTQEKNFSCEICGGCYVTKESLLYHTRTHTGEKPYQCEHCNQRFLSASRRSEHIRRHHMEPTLECDVCHTKFRGRSCLLRHKKRHFDPNSRLHYTKLAENEV